MMHDYRAERKLKQRVVSEIAEGRKEFDHKTVMSLILALQHEQDRFHVVVTELKRICRPDANVKDAHEVIATWQPVFARDGWMLDHVAAVLDDWENTEVPDGT
jgi:hypothetical protein